MSINPNITCITVCRNCKNDLIKTFKSLLEQHYTDFEVVVIDGNSTDGTSELLQEYERIFERKKINFFFLSEPDSGTYDAMNKGIKYAQGTWTIFLNAGDCLASSKTFSNVFKNSKYEGVSAIYGNYTYVFKNKSKRIQCAPVKEIKNRKPSSHQSFFNLTSCLKERGFNTKYKIMADYEWYLQLFLQKKKFLYVDIDICLYDGYGLSSCRQNQAYRECMQIRKEMGQKRDFLLIRIAKEMVFFIIDFGRKHFGILY